MKELLAALLGSSPAAVAVIYTVVQFLKFLREERAALRDAVVVALNANSLAVEAQTEAMKCQAETMRSLIGVIERHDLMVREAVARIEGKSQTFEEVSGLVNSFLNARPIESEKKKEEK